MPLEKKSERVACILPAYNEEGKIGKVVLSVIQEEIVEAVVAVDDGSTDQTAREAESSGATVIRHARNSGVGAAIRSGLIYAREKGFTVALIMGADDQDNPDEIHRLLYPILNDRFDFVQGSRYMSGGRVENIPLFRLVTTRFFSFLAGLLLAHPLTDGTNGFRSFRLSILDHSAINIHQEWLDHYELEPYIYYKAIENKFYVTEVPVTKRYPQGHSGYTKMIPVLSWWSILRPLLLLRLGIKK